MRITVLNQRGTHARTAILVAVPDASIVDVPEDGTLAEEVRGDVLLASDRARNLEALATRVSWVHLPSTGVDWVPRSVLTSCQVTCSRGSTSAAIAEFAIAAILAVEKRLPDVWVRSPPERWSASSMGTLRDRRVGLVGLGSIGQNLARLLLPFGAEIRAFRRQVGRSSPIAGVVVEQDLDSVLSWAEHLVLAAPATPETHHLLDERALRLVTPGVHVVNVARGSLIDQDALRIALDSGRVGLATLDVCTPEPLPDGHWLYTHPKVRLSPHVSWNSPLDHDPVVDLFIANLHRHLAGTPLNDLVDPEVGY